MIINFRIWIEISLRKMKFNGVELYLHEMDVVFGRILNESEKNEEGENANM